MNTGNPFGIKLTAALPTWNNKNIINISLLSLERQENPPPYELIVNECENDCGKDYFEKWLPRLEKNNCKRILYLNGKERMPLSLKWREMADYAVGEHFLLWASDDYSPKERMRKTYEADADWYNCQKGYSYHIQKDKLILFNKGNFRDKAGFNKSIRTSLMKQLPFEEKWEYVDSWIFANIKARKIFVDENIYSSVNTTGVNSISKSRGDYFDKIKYPFEETNQTIETIGLPHDIVQILKYSKELRNKIYKWKKCSIYKQFDG